MIMSSREERKTSRVPAWVPLAAFAGTTIALAMPLVYLARSRKSVLRKSLNESAAVPPKRSVTMSSNAHLPRASTSTALASESESTTSSSASPGTGELLSAISRMDLTTAKFAGKAFAIATGIVTLGGVVLTVGIKSAMGVKDTKEFADRMRIVFREGLPGLNTQIHRPPETTEEGAEFLESPEVVSSWSWDDAEKRLQDAYREGGLPAWFQTASQELEAELQLVRTRRRHAQDRGNVELTESPSPTKPNI